jgi:hypothetical protein
VKTAKAEELVTGALGVVLGIGDILQTSTTFKLANKKWNMFFALAVAEDSAVPLGLGDGERVPGDKSPGYCHVVPAGQKTCALLVRKMFGRFQQRKMTSKNLRGQTQKSLGWFPLEGFSPSFL